MKKLLLVFTAIFISTFSITTASAQTASTETPKADAPKQTEDNKTTESPLLSKWDVVISAPGQSYTGILKLEKAGDAYTGSVTTELGEAPLGNIKVDGDSFTATIVVNAMGNSINGTMSGKVKDNALAGELVLDGLGSIPYAGKKP